MPWRRHVSPYRTWISEIMLQQTTVAAVAPRFERFFAEFPDPGALAAAPEERVLRAWAGLGYYSRARNLRRAAQEIVARHGGRFPDSPEAVLALPGVGRYTAGAILSIAFGRRAALVDGNVMRVFSRLFAVEEDVKSPAAAKLFWTLAERLVDERRPGDWNQALMELGATVCLPEGPRCEACPVAALCRARALGRERELPVMPKRREWETVRWSCLWLAHGDDVVLWKRGPHERLFKGFWALPEARHVPEARPGRRLAQVKGTVTHHKVAIDVHEAAAPRRLPEGAQWVALESLDERLVSSLWLKAARAARAALASPRPGRPARA